jgi:hypothetical protein
MVLMVLMVLIVLELLTALIGAVRNLLVLLEGINNLLI